MQFATWEPIYNQILQDFGFSSSRDEEGALLLENLLQGRRNFLAIAQEGVGGREAVVFGNAPSLDHEVDMLPPLDAALIAADGAAAEYRILWSQILMAHFLRSWRPARGGRSSSFMLTAITWMLSKGMYPSLRISSAPASAGLLQAFTTSEDSQTEIGRYSWRKSLGRHQLSWSALTSRTRA